MGSLHPTVPSVTVSAASFREIHRFWRRGEGGVDWRCLFSTPAWTTAWWQSFGAGRTLRLVVFREGDDLVGVAPLMVRGDEASLVGSEDVCDHVDISVRKGRAVHCTAALLEALRVEGVTSLSTGPVRADAAVAEGLEALGSRLDGGLVRESAGSTREMALPGDWEGFLRSLSGKERHEIRRKARRLEAAGRTAFRRGDTADGIHTAMDRFITLFRANRPDKAAFMTPAMEGFFRGLAAETARAGLLRLFFLDLDGAIAAGVFCLDHRGVRHLYNNGYDWRYRHLSAGLLGKVMSIRDAIDAGCRRYDFLKGDEPYKARLGGLPAPLYRYRVDLSILGG